MMHAGRGLHKTHVYLGCVDVFFECQPCLRYEVSHLNRVWLLPLDLNIG